MTNKVFEICRQIIEGHFPNPNLDFNSGIYAHGIENDLSIIKDYLNTGNRILDLGCGKGHITAWLADAGFDSIGVDLSQTPGESFSGVSVSSEHSKWQINIWRETGEKFRSRYLFYDGQSIPLADNSFDAVVAYAMIEHVPKENWDNILQEISRVLKPKGWLFIFRCPRNLSYQEFLNRSHEVLVGEKEIVFQLENNNYHVISLERTDMIPGFVPKPLSGLWNKLSPMLNALDKLLLKTPLNLIAHHMRVICQKV